MKRLNGTIHLSTSDIVGHLNCNHLSALDVRVASGLLAKPDHYDPLLEILRERGYRHEQAYIEHLEARGYKITVIEGFDITEEAVEATIEAMRKGKAIITQGALRYNRWSGRADILKRVEIPSDFGDWSYEVIDTKLARETKGGTILQLCLYADLLTDMQGVAPDHVYVVAPWSDYEPQVFRVADYAAYFRRVKTAAEVAVDQGSDSITYPEPKDHCTICRWRNQCDQRRRDDDHLCLVANITKNQICELQANGIATTQALADMPIPIPFVPRKGSPVSIEKAKAQASIQVQAREAGELRYELLDVVQETVLAVFEELRPCIRSDHRHSRAHGFQGQPAQALRNRCPQPDIELLEGKGHVLPARIPKVLHVPRQIMRSDFTEPNRVHIGLVLLLESVNRSHRLPRSFGGVSVN